MNRKPLMRRAASLLAATLIGAAGAVCAADTGWANAEFLKFDANRDGYVNRDEARNIREFDKAFSEADDNRDGKLDAAEFIKAQSIHEREAAGHFVDDSVITAMVKAALLKDPVVSALTVSVATRGGTVLLSGFVENHNQLRRAQEVAASVQGVITVKNSLVVKS